MGATSTEPGPRTGGLVSGNNEIRSILEKMNVFAIVGASSRPVRASYFVQGYLRKKGFTVYPVNPLLVGQEILGHPVYERLADVPEPIDIVSIFRKSEAAGETTDQAIEVGAKVVWMQLGVRNDAAANRAIAAGLRVVMNRCPKMEYGRFSGEMGWIGYNTGVISSRATRLGIGS